MTPEQFAYWLQGFAELNSNPPSKEQWDSIREHLGTVFQKVTPQLGGPGLTYPPGVRSPSPLTEYKPTIIC